MHVAKVGGKSDKRCSARGQQRKTYTIWCGAILASEWEGCATINHTWLALVKAHLDGTYKLPNQGLADWCHECLKAFVANTEAKAIEGGTR